MHFLNLLLSQCVYIYILRKKNVVLNALRKNSTFCEDLL